MDIRNRIRLFVVCVVLFNRGILTANIAGEHTQVDDTHVDLLPDGSNKVTSNPFKSSTHSSCLLNEYGPSCNYCLPHDTCVDGHYACDKDTGNKLCLPGWHGDDCTEQDTPEVQEYHASCPENQCRNGGTCAANKCCCVKGFTGVLCEIEIIECTNDTCINGGICQDIIGSFTCICRPDFSGKRCETHVHKGLKMTTRSSDSSCQTHTCRNNGRCFEDAFYTYCLCPIGFTGDHCETNILASNASTSSCPEHHYGDKCDVVCIPQDNCHDGHFVCHPFTGSKICISGWIGQNCDARLLPWRLDPMCPNNLGCKNDGACFQKSCCCKHNYTGDFCNAESVGCISNPCKNNGTCTSSGNGFTCDCEKDFTGRQCESLIYSLTIPPWIGQSSTMHLQGQTSSTSFTSSSHFTSASSDSVMPSLSMDSSSLSTHVTSTKEASLYTTVPTEYITSSTSVYLNDFSSPSPTLDSSHSVMLTNTVEVISTSHFLDISTKSFEISPSTMYTELSASSSLVTSTPPITTLSSSKSLLTSSISTVESSMSHISSSMLINPSTLVVTPPVTKLPTIVSTSSTVGAASSVTSPSVSPTSSSTSTETFIPSVSITIENPGNDGPVDKRSTESRKSLSWWVILVIVACVVVVVGFLMVLIVARIHQRSSDSRTLQNKPEMISAFDKEHFSAQPDVNHHDYEVPVDDWDGGDVHHDIYVVNN